MRKQINKVRNFRQFLNESINKVIKTIVDDSVPVTNNPNILKWLVDCQTNSYLNNQKHLSQNLLKELEETFGSSNKSLRLKFMTKVWILKYNGLTFNVFTAKNQGTSIEICGYDYEDIRTGTKEEEIINFLEELHRLINGIE
jgi:hypothetical protein